MTIPTLLTVVLYVLVGCLLTWAIYKFVPLEDLPKQIMAAIVWVLILIKCLYLLGLV